ncbi:hypothetical protein RR47_GL000468 [Enterococcus columbae DSM 7374 = ATCC 51263]|nr:hypothetical protein RR47_GL000468 [Enterococcus columbae DSM 7374 = ATCC 51263]
MEVFMNQLSARMTIQKYLQERQIVFFDYLNHENRCLVVNLQGFENCPANRLEASFCFYSKCVEVRVYYTQFASNWLKNKKDDLSRIYRLLNYLNATIWLPINDGRQESIYPKSYFYTPRFILTEDETYDLCCEALIDYDVFEMAPLATLDYFTAVIPEYLNEVSIPIFFTLLDKITVDEAIQMIEQKKSSLF